MKTKAQKQPMAGIDLINASAGSGKTYSLTARVMEKLTGGLEPESLMATTFTNKAAQELRERIRFRLLREGMSQEAWRIYDGFVGTVNSICARFLREYAIEAGLSPALDVLPEEDGKRLFGVAVAKTVEAHADRLEPVARRLSQGDWRNDVQRIVNLARSNRIPPERLRECARLSIATLDALLGDTSSDDGLDGKLDETVANAIADLEEIESPKQKTAVTLETLRKFKKDRAKNNGDVPWSEWGRLAKLETNRDGEGTLDEVTAVAGEVLAHPLLRRDLEEAIEGVFACAAEAVRLYDDYKTKQGLMDFTDQEIKVLELAQENDAFRESMKDRLRQMMVDEFQDTSPVQLALFLVLHDLAGDSVWVGDPKQAIYGFRDTDPQLMDEVTERIDGPQVLGYSWRSKALLVEFCNAVFTRVFHSMGEERVRLKIPEPRAEEAEGGKLDLWHLLSRNANDDAAALAAGVRDLLQNESDIVPGDIAVLCRRNEQCEAVAAELETLGIRASAAQGSLLTTRECRLAVAALRTMNDRRDTVALAEIVRLSPQHSGHADWLSSLIAEPEETLARWEQDPLIQILVMERKGLFYRTPLEALKLAIDAVALPQSLKSWTNPPMRRANLDMLCGACCEYMDQCRARRSAATVTGFIGWLMKAEPPQAQGAGKQTVQVLTWHGAKGLEWPVVILASLNEASRGGAFGTHIVPAETFDPADPLAGRSIRFWPWPFGLQKKFEPLEDRLAASDEDRFVKERALRELRRLMYVGMTRARDRMIFAVRKKETKARGTELVVDWLDELSDELDTPLIQWPMQTGEQQVRVGDGTFPIRVGEFAPLEPSGFDVEGTGEFLLPDAEWRAYPPACVVPSSLAADENILAGVVLENVADFGAALPVSGEVDDDGYFGAGGDDLSEEERLALAQRLLSNWNVEGAIAPVDLVAAGERLNAFIRECYPDARVLREWPVSMVNTEGQRMQGWIDLLLELSGGYVVIDHKSTSGMQREHLMGYVPQLLAYREAVERATGKKVLATLLHLPVRGRVVEVVRQ